MVIRRQLKQMLHSSGPAAPECLGLRHWVFENSAWRGLMSTVVMLMVALSMPRSAP